ncbi:hypothetical protein AB0939_08095 [Streptomyces sp. NPDC006990]|uniref:hypothetical protein n=1 Tax=unclassified Streptomyces TaxID=2593676 RepID=UPI0034539FC8
MTNVAYFRPLLEPANRDGFLVTFNALPRVQGKALKATWLVETEYAHYIAVIRRIQPTAYQQFAAMPWSDIADQHAASSIGHGRHELRSIKTCSMADESGGPPCFTLGSASTGAGRPVDAKPARLSTPSPAHAHQATPAELAAPSAATGTSKPCTTSEA